MFHATKKIQPGSEEMFREGILRTLAYFDIFHYPLTRDEIKTFLFASIGDITFDRLLEQLERDEMVFLYKGYYSIQQNPLLAFRRMQGNARAMLLLNKAQKIGRFLYQFPFVKAVCISGSLSKNFADDKADIDFFIITGNGRLWIARTLMHLYKKMAFLRGRQHYYCMNYYVDEQAFKIPEQNLFTATEIKTLLPVCGEKTMKAFFTANNWADNWLPACAFRSQERKDPKASWLKRAGEWLFNGRPGNHIEKILFAKTTKRWDRKSLNEKRNYKGARMALITGPHFAKSNPGEFQEKVMNLYRQKLAFLRATNVFTEEAHLAKSKVES